MDGTFSWNNIFNYKYLSSYGKTGSFSGVLIPKLISDPWTYLLIINVCYLNLYFPIFLWGGIIDGIYELYYNEEFLRLLYVPVYASAW